MQIPHKGRKINKCVCVCGKKNTAFAVLVLQPNNLLCLIDSFDLFKPNFLKYYSTTLLMYSTFLKRILLILLQELKSLADLRVACKLLHDVTFHFSHLTVSRQSHVEGQAVKCYFFCCTVDRHQKPLTCCSPEG